MAYHRYEPIDPRAAFEVTAYPDAETTQDAAASQAATLLGARAGVLGIADSEMAAIEAEATADGFTMPDLRPLQRTRRMRVDEATQYLGLSAAEVASEPSSAAYQPELARTAQELFERPSTEAAAALFEGSMHSPHPLVRVAAAAGSRETTRLRSLSRQILEEGADADDPLVADVARTALASFARHDPVVEKYVAPAPGSAHSGKQSHTAAITHGTFAAGSDWYQPAGDFYEALVASNTLPVHDASFTWSGAYSRAARRADARLLKQWIDDEGLARPDFFAHSHGGTVAQLATRDGAEYDRLVLMAMPVHAEWFPDFNRINRIIDVRVRLDLVILADRGGQRYRTDQIDIEEHRHGWFDHSAPHESEYWDDHNLWDVL